MEECEGKGRKEEEQEGVMERGIIGGGGRRGEKRGKKKGNLATYIDKVKG